MNSGFIAAELSYRSCALVAWFSFSLPPDVLLCSSFAFPHSKTPTQKTHLSRHLSKHIWGILAVRSALLPSLRLPLLSMPATRVAHATGHSGHFFATPLAKWIQSGGIWSRSGCGFMEECACRGHISARTQESASEIPHSREIGQGCQE